MTGHPAYWKKSSITPKQRDEIRAKYAAALEDDPGLRVGTYAKVLAPEYGVSAELIRAVINGS